MNEREKRLIELFQENSLVIANSTFQQGARRLYTWKNPGDIHRNLDIDINSYIFIDIHRK